MSRTYIEADDVTTEVELSLFDNVDGSHLLFLHLNRPFHKDKFPNKTAQQADLLEV